MSEIDNSSAGGVKFISVRRWQAGKEWRPLGHAHPYCEIVIVLRGEERAVVEGVPVQCKPGYFMFYPPACFHEERQAGEDLLEFLCLDFHWPACPQGMPRRIQDRQGRIQEIIRWLLVEDRANYAEKGGYQNMATRLVVAEVQRLVENGPDDTLALIYEYIHRNLDRPILLEELGELACLNKFYLVRVFRARTGMTPMEYVRQARLEMAHQLLLESDLPLREIAPRVGIANEYHLSRLLKARYGRGARELRRIKMPESEPAE